MEETVCTSCGKTLMPGDWPWCPHGLSSLVVSQDGIPGGLLIRHGLCNPDGSPRRYDSKSEIRKEAKRRGLTNHVEHLPDRKGSDRSKHTQRFI